MLSYSKDGITVATMLDTRYQKTDGKYPVKIRITHNRQRLYYTTGKNLLPDEWDALPSTKAHALTDIRRNIEGSFQNVRKAVEELADAGNFSFDALNNRLKAVTADTLNSMLQAKITALEATRQLGDMGTASIFKNVLKWVTAFAGEQVRFENLSVEWIRRYERFLRSHNLAQGTIAIHFERLRAILNEARQAGIVKESQYPFGRGRYEIQAGEGRKLALTLEQIGQVARYDDGKACTAKYRDYWLFIYLCNGINVADFVKLKYKNIVNGEICFVRQKTEHTARRRKEIHAIIVRQMQDIINKYGNPPSADNYIFPILQGNESPEKLKRLTNQFTRAINRCMNKIGRQVGIGNISTYTARHSFATVLKRSGANILYISESLGHSNVKTTEVYLASFEREEREKNAELLTKF